MRRHSARCRGGQKVPVVPAAPNTTFFRPPAPLQLPAVLPVITDCVDTVASDNVSNGTYEPTTGFGPPVNISEPVPPPGLVMVRVGKSTLVVTIPTHSTSTKKPGVVNVIVPVGKYAEQLFAPTPWMTPLPVIFPVVGGGVPRVQPNTFPEIWISSCVA